jgi:hypothetical protein
VRPSLLVLACLAVPVLSCGEIQNTAELDIETRSASLVGDLCGESSCTAVTQSGESLFRGWGCIGYEAVFSYHGLQSWDGQGLRGYQARSLYGNAKKTGAGCSANGAIAWSGPAYFIYRGCGSDPCFSVSITGPSSVKPDAMCTWVAHVSGGTPPYRLYIWRNLFSTDYQSSWVTGSLSSSNTIEVVVTDDNNRTAGATRFINVSPSARACPT